MPDRTVERPVVIEIGAGTAIPTVRYFGEAQRGPLIRINPREPQVGSEGDVSLAMIRVQGMRGIAEALRAEGLP